MSTLGWNPVGSFAIEIAQGFLKKFSWLAGDRGPGIVSVVGPNRQATTSPTSQSSTKLEEQPSSSPGTKVPIMVGGQVSTCGKLGALDGIDWFHQGITVNGENVFGHESRS